MQITDYQKIEEVKKTLKLSYNAIAKELKLKTPQVFYDIKAGKCGISKELALLIQDNYGINISWLLTGEGEMMTKNTSQEVTSYQIPLLPVSAIGGSLQDWSLSVKLSDCEQIISPVCDVEFAMTVAGESMAPKYPSGCRIFCKKINEKAFIEWGKVYVLDTCNGPVIKVCNQSETSDNIRCSSLNADQTRYQPFDIPKTEIYGMYRILANMSID